MRWPTSRSFPAGSSVSPGTEQERLADINQLAQLPGRNCIVSAVPRRLRRQSPAAAYRLAGTDCPPAGDPLLICGHSDFTAIQSGLLATGNVITFSGLIARGQLRRGDPRSVYRAPFLAGATARILPRMAGRRAELPGGRHPVGGNLAMLDLAYRHAVATGDPRRHPGWWRISTSTRSASSACCFSCCTAAHAGGAESSDLWQLYRQRAKRL